MWRSEKGQAFLISDLKREESRKQDMGDYEWSRNFDPSRGIGAVDDGRVLGYP